MNTVASGVLQTGTYLISNVKNGNNVIQVNDNTKAPLVARSDPSSAFSKARPLYLFTALINICLIQWNVTLLGNGNYNIINYQFSTHSATTTAMAKTGENVVGLPTRVQPWTIRETGINGNYM